MSAPLLQPDKVQLGRFLDALLLRAATQSRFSVRGFDDNDDGPPLFVADIRCGAQDRLERAYDLAVRAANHPTMSVVCAIPGATFCNDQARLEDVVEGLVLSVECDANPQQALDRMTANLGPPTLVVESGGRWFNAATGLDEPKLHLHFRLAVPTREPLEHTKLRTGRKYAAHLTGADRTNISIVHPTRGAGTVHRKNVPRLARIIQDNGTEIDLDWALQRLRAELPADYDTRSAAAGTTPHPDKTASIEDVAAAASVTPNEDCSWDDFNRFGMAVYVATGGDDKGFEVFDNWASKSTKYDAEATEARWKHYATSPPNRAGAGTLFWLAKRAVPGWRKPSSLTPEAKAEAERAFAEKWFTELPEPEAAATVKPEPLNITPGFGHNGRPTIRLLAGDIAGVVDRAEAALIARGGLYQRANQIVFLGEAPVVTADQREVRGQRILERGEHALTEDIATAAGFERFDLRKNEWVNVTPPPWIGKTLKDRVGKLNFKILTGVINAPTLRPDASLLFRPGYDDATGLYFDPRGTVFPEIRTAPSRADAERAVATLDEVIVGFPFVSSADRSVALSAFLTACVRQALATAPLHGFSAPTAGSGKSKLVDVASALATGREAAVIAQGKSEEETEKRLGALFRAGDLMVSIDNCEEPLGGEFLCQALTQPSVRVRILGLSEAPEFSTRALITATGNNLVVRGDMTRRTLLCQLDPQVERPELRTFGFEPVAMVKADRGRYVAAALTVLLAYHHAGRPNKAASLGSFEQWSDLVRSALIWLGRDDPVETMERARASDPRLDELSTILTLWHGAIGGEKVSAKQVIDAAGAHSDFREALLVVSGQGGLLNSRRLGRWLGKVKNKITKNLVIHEAGILDGIQRWSVSTTGAVDVGN